VPRRRQRARATVSVDHEQVDGVGADVEDSQAHALTLGAHGRRTAGAGSAAVARGRTLPWSP